MTLSQGVNFYILTQDFPSVSQGLPFSFRHNAKSIFYTKRLSQSYRFQAEPEQPNYFANSNVSKLQSFLFFSTLSADRIVLAENGQERLV